MVIITSFDEALAVKSFKGWDDAIKKSFLEDRRVSFHSCFAFAVIMG